MVHSISLTDVLIFLGSAFLVSVIVGPVSAWLIINKNTQPTFKSGVWTHNANVGSTTANPWLRARVANEGILGMVRHEAIYFIATQDSEGNPLNGSYSYTLKGKDFDSRWWSVTAYNSNFFLIPNPQERYSFNKSNINRQDKLDEFSIIFSNQEKVGNWIPIDSGHFNVLLRIYNVREDFLEAIERIDLPIIEKESSDYER